jgi:hypothetical protein
MSYGANVSVYSEINTKHINAMWQNVFPQCHHMSLMDFVVSLPGYGRSVTDFRGWKPMRRSYVVPMRWMVIYEYEVPGGW